MTPFKKGIVFVIGLIIVVSFIRLIALFVPNPQTKYTIYAADKVYHCNEFQVSGNTIYFKDTRKKNVCINGNYTLIYETEDKQ
jgi:cbb3-type cytochrome oxidase cytochrome c subunit